MAWIDSLLVVGLLVLLLIVTVFGKLLYQWQRSDDRHRARIQPNRRRRRRRTARTNDSSLSEDDDNSSTNSIFDEWEELRWIFQLAPHLMAYHSLFNNSSRQRSSTASTEHSRQERRQIFIGEMLLHKKVVAESTRSSTGKDDNTSTSTTLHKLSADNTPLPTLHRLKSDMILVHGKAKRTETASENAREEDTDDDASQTEQHSCPICLKDYHIDDEICWSPNRNCNHAFHRECIEAWLLHHENCPMCRQNYCNSSRIPPISVNGSNGGILIPPALDDDEFVQMVDSVERMYQEAFARLYGHEDIRLVEERMMTPNNSADLQPQNTSSISETDPYNHDIESTGE